MSNDLVFQAFDIYDVIIGIFNSMGVQLAIKGFFIYIVLLWIALIIWVTRDIVNRSGNILLQVLSILLVAILNIFGLVLYLVIRPAKTLIEEYNEDLERKMFIETFSEFYNCIGCGAKVEKDFNYCPHCATECKVKCKSCAQMVMLSWSNCPYCKADIEKKELHIDKQEEIKFDDNKPIEEKKDAKDKFKIV